MDLGFFRRTRLGEADRASAGLDYGVLTATLQAYQAASATARAQARPAVNIEMPVCPQASLVEILVSGPNWQRAIEEQQGSFNVEYAKNSINA